MNNKTILKRFSLVLWMNLVAYFIPLVFSVVLINLSMSSQTTAGKLSQSFAMYIVAFVATIIPLLVLRLILIFLKKDKQIRIKYLVLSYLQLLIFPIFFIFQTIYLSRMSEYTSYVDIFKGEGSLLNVVMIVLIALSILYNIFVIVYGHLITKPIIAEEVLKRKKEKNDRKIVLNQEKQKRIQQLKIEKEKQYEARQLQKQKEFETKQIQKQTKVVACQKENDIVVKTKQSIQNIKSNQSDDIFNVRNNIFKYLAIAFGIFAALFSLAGLLNFLSLMGVGGVITIVNSFVVMILAGLFLLFSLPYYIYALVSQFIKKDQITLAQKLSNKILFIVLPPFIILTFLLFLDLLPTSIHIFPQIIFRSILYPSSSICILVLGICFFALFIACLILNYKTYLRLYKQFDSEAENIINEDWLKTNQKSYDKLMSVYLKVNNYFHAKQGSTKVKNTYNQVNALCIVITIVSFLPCLIWPIVIFSQLFKGDQSAIGFINYMIYPVLLYFLIFVFEITILFLRKTYYKAMVGNVVFNEQNNDLEEKYSYFSNYYMSHCISDKVVKRNVERNKLYARGPLIACYDDVWTALFVGLPLTFIFIYIAIFVILLSIILSAFSDGSSTSSTNSMSSNSESSTTDNNQEPSSSQLRLEGNGYNEWYDIDSNGDIRINGSYTDFRLIGNDICHLEGDTIKQWKTIATLSSGSNEGTVLYLNNYDGPKLFMKWHK